MPHTETLSLLLQCMSARADREHRIRPTHRGSEKGQAKDHIDDRCQKENDNPGNHHCLVVLLSDRDREEEKLFSRITISECRFFSFGRLLTPHKATINKIEVMTHNPDRTSMTRLK